MSVISKASWESQARSEEGGLELRVLHPSQSLQGILHLVNFAKQKLFAEGGRADLELNKRETPRCCRNFSG